MDLIGEADVKDGEGEEDEDEEDEDGNSTSRKGGKRRNASGKGSKQRRSLAHKRHARTRRGEKTNLGLNLRVQLWKWPPAFERSRWSSLHGEADRIGLDLHAIPDVFLACVQSSFFGTQKKLLEHLISPFYFFINNIIPPFLVYTRIYIMQLPAEEGEARAF